MLDRQSTAQLTFPIIPALQTPTPATSQIASAIPSSPPSAISNLLERSIFHVPYDQNPYFTGRDELLATIRHKIQDSQLKGHKHRIALYGLGGVGKTQMTLEYCFRYKRDYNYIFWMSAADESRLLSSFAQVATLTECVRSTSEQNPQEIARIVLRWLHSRTKWLMVFDNLDDISVINGYLPPVDGSGHVLITTRNKHCDGIPAEGIEVIPLNSTDSVSFLLTRSGLQDDPRQQVKEEARKIVHELGHLPLAIEQAAAYIRTSQNIFEYLPTYHQSRKDLLSEKPGTNHPYTESIGTTWKMSLHRLSSNAIKLIQILAFLNPDEILIEFLKAGSTGLLPEYQHLFNTDFVLRQSLRDLESCSLLRVWDEGQKITIHRLVQYVIRDDLDPEAESRMTFQIIQLGLYAFPSIPVENISMCRRYQSQVTAIIFSSQTHPTLAEAQTPNTFPWIVLASRLARYLRADGYYLHSLKSFEECLEVTRKLLGEEHPQTLWNLHNVAVVSQSLGNFNHALKLFQECYERRGRVLGPEHPDTLHSMNGVGEAYTNLGRFTEGLKMFEESFEVRKRVMGLEHSDTLESMYNLAAAYFALGKFNQALHFSVEGFEGRRRVLGPEHPETLKSMAGMAATYASLGRLHEGLKVFEECLEIRKMVLGSKHPETLASMQNLVMTYIALGRLNEALELEEECFEIRKRVLGVEHPDTLRTMNGVAVTYSRMGRSDEAANVFEKCFEMTKRVLGGEHPDTLASMNKLGVEYANLGRFTESMEILENCLELNKRILGPKHPDTLWNMYNLTMTYVSLGRLDQALKMQENCLELRRKELGEEHSETLNSMNSLGVRYAGLGRFTEAAEIHENCLETRKRVQGPEHPDTLWSMSNLSLTYARLGQLDEAVKMQENCLELRRKVLGEDHPETLDSMANLGWEYANLKRFTEAAEIHENCLESRKRILGLEHPGTLSSMDHLARAYTNLGRLDEAIQMQGKCLELRRKVLGEEHSDTLASMNSLEVWRRDLDSLNKE